MFSGCDDGRGWKEGEDRKDPGRVQQQQRGHKKPFRCSINTRVGRDQLGNSIVPRVFIQTSRTTTTTTKCGRDMHAFTIFLSQTQNMGSIHLSILITYSGLL